MKSLTRILVWGAFVLLAVTGLHALGIGDETSPSKAAFDRAMTDYNHPRGH